MKIIYEMNPKFGKYGWLYMDEDGLSALKEKLSQVKLGCPVELEQGVDISIIKILVYSESEFRSREIEIARINKNSDRLGLISCAVIILLGVTIGTTIAGVLLGLLTKMIWG